MQASLKVSPLVARVFERFAMDERQRISKRVDCHVRRKVLRPQDQLIDHPDVGHHGIVNV